MTTEAAKPAPVREGDVLAGKYVIERVLGAGGMGVVVLAHHMHLDERVAIKFLLAEAMAHPEAVARFHREARAAVKIKGEHVARVIDVGTLENGAPYMVMEYLQGSDLSALSAARGPLPIDEAAEYMLQACEALAEAHVLGIVHRDLKPGNLFVTTRPDGTPSIKVIDFGISKSVGGGSDGVRTATTALMGSPLYMSPEQLYSAKNVDPRGDIWALGVILYELLTREVPFSGDTLMELCLKISQSEFAPIRTLRPDVPPGVEAIILRCLKKERDARFASVAELAGALSAFAPPRAQHSAERAAKILQRSVGVQPSSIPSSVGVPSNSTPMPTPAPEASVAPAQPLSMATPALSAGTQGDLSNWGNTRVPARPRRRKFVVGVAATVILGLAAMGGFAARRLTAPAEAVLAAPVVTTPVRPTPPNADPPAKSEPVTAPIITPEPSPTPTANPSPTPGPAASSVVPDAPAPKAVPRNAWRPPRGKSSGSVPPVEPNRPTPPPPSPPKPAATSTDELGGRT